MSKRFSAAAVLLAITAPGLLAEETATHLAPMKIFANWEVTEIESFVPDPSSTASGYFREIQNSSSIWLLQEARLADNAKVFLGVGGMYFFILPSKGNQYSIGQRSGFGFTDLHGEFEFWPGDEGQHGLLLKAGVFPFKYNENAKNLGEYMFRTLTYPNIIFTGGLTRVNSAGVQLGGIDANTKLFGFTNDLLLTTKTDQTPAGALSLTDIVSYTVGGVFTIGAGYMFDNFYDPTKIATGKYDVRENNKYYVLANGTKKLLHPLNATDLPYDPTVDVAVDSGRLTFQGQKAMLRASLDIGKMFSSSLFSEKDLRLYAEGILMGVQNRPFYYTKMKDRIAYTLGFNFPTFRILDVLAAEYEYCSNPYPNDAIQASLNLSPIPPQSETGSPVNGDNFKWTIYAQKNIYPGFTLTGHIANDHMRLVDYFGHTNDRDVMPLRKNWYWSLQMGYSI